MRRVGSSTSRFFQQPIGAWSRLTLVVLTGLMLALYFWPLWNLTMFAPQYPQGLTLDIFHLQDSNVRDSWNRRWDYPYHWSRHE